MIIFTILSNLLKSILIYLESMYANLCIQAEKYMTDSGSHFIKES